LSDRSTVCNLTKFIAFYGIYVCCKWTKQKGEKRETVEKELESEEGIDEKWK
jgi:hypothetical protein